MIISVEDTGSGIRPENLEKIFAQYQQVDAKSNRALVGTGLGLAIVKRLAEQMGCEIRASLAGNRFSISILWKTI